MMILGEAPGRVSLDNGRGFSNPRNLTIRRAFASAIAPSQAALEQIAYLTDTVKCWPATPTGANRSPLASELRPCVGRHLAAELAIVRPRVIIAFGNLAAAAALGFEVKIGLAHGRAHRSLTGVRVIPLMHPSTRNIAGMKAVGIISLDDYENRLAKLFRDELARLDRDDNSGEAGCAGHDK